MLTIPIDRLEFIDRKEILELLHKRVKAIKQGYRQNIALLGPEMVGKTSILSRFISQLEEEDKEILPIYLAVREEPMGPFLSRFMRAILYYALRKSKNKVVLPADDLAALKNQAASLCPLTLEGLLKIERLMEQNRPGQAFGAIFDLLPELGKELHLPVLFILDEFQLMMSMNIKRPYLLFGERILSQKEVMYIVTSSAVEAGKEILAHDLSLLFGNFEQILIKPFDYQASREFLNQRLRWVNLKPVHKKFLIMITGGYPFYLELIARSLRRFVQEYRVGQVPASLLVQAITEEVFRPASFIYRYIERTINRWLDGPSRWNTLAVLLAVAGGKKKVRDISKSLGLSATPVARYLHRLTRAGLVKKCGSIYLVAEPMVSLWLSLAYKTVNEALQPDYFSYEEGFKKELEKLINIFEEEDAKTAAERLRNLFRAFKNDVVKLNGHRFKLPYFNEIEHRVVKGIDLPVIARVRNRYWLPQVMEKRVEEKDVRQIMAQWKELPYRRSFRVVVCLEGIENDARVLAQEDGLTIWEAEDINTLMNIYNQCPLIS